MEENENVGGRKKERIKRTGRGSQKGRMGRSTGKRGNEL